MSKEYRLLRAQEKAKIQGALEWDTQTVKFRRILAWILFALCMAVYGLTLFPSVSGGDSGDLLAAICSLGIAHPPGYPLLTLLGKIFTWIPFGSIAWRVNLLSAAADAGAAVLLFLSVSRISKNIWAGVVAGALFAFSPLVWSYAVQTEVFALNHLFVALLFYLATRYHEEPTRKLIYLAALVFGLGLTNHQTLLFIGIPILIWMIFLDRKAWIAVPCFILAGMSVYFYLLFAPSKMSVTAWGITAHWDGFIQHILRSYYGTLNLASVGETPIRFIDHLGYYFSDLLTEFLFVGIPLALWGLASYLKKSVLVRVTLVIFLAYVFLFLAKANLPETYRVVLVRFWLFPNIFVCVWIGLGFERLSRYFTEKLKIWVPILASGLVVLQIGMNYKNEDQHRQYAFHSFGEALLAPLLPHSILLIRADLYTNTTRYLQNCENFRPDVTILDRDWMLQDWMKEKVAYNFPEITVPGVAYQREGNGYNLKNFLDANLKRFPVSAPSLHKDEENWKDSYRVWPYGLVNRFFPKDAPFELSSYLIDSEKAYSAVENAALTKVERGSSWEYYIVQEYWTSEYNKIKALLDYANEKGNRALDLKPIISFISQLIERQEKNSYEKPYVLYKGLGLAYKRLTLSDPSVDALATAAWKRYLELTPPEDPDIAVISRAVREFDLARKHGI